MSSNTNNPNQQNNAPAATTVLNIQTYNHNGPGQANFGITHNNPPAGQQQQPTTEPPPPPPPPMPTTQNGRDIIERKVKSGKNTREFLRPMYSDLLENTNAALREKAYDKSVISSNDLHQAANPLFTPMERNRILYNNFFCRDDFNVLIVSLEEIGDHKIIERMLENLN